MKKSVFILITVLWVSICLTNPVISKNNNPAQKGNLRVLTLQGTPHERGIEHGKALKKDIHELVRLWKTDIERSYKTDADEFIKRFLSETNFEKAIKRWTPELWDELKGISEGSGIDFDTMFAFQLVDEIWVLGRDIQTDKCTTFGEKKTIYHPAIVAQNLDIPSFYHGFQTLLRFKDSERDMETLLFTFPGFIAANGINSHSVAVVVNAVQQLDNSRDGLPVAFVIRGILQQKSYKEAVKFIQTVQHGAPQNYMIGGLEDAGSFECATTTVSQFIPFEKAEFTYHTNHPLENKNYNPQFLQYLESSNTSPEAYGHYCPRFQSLHNLLKDNSARIDVDVLKDIFSNRETLINNSGTFGCTIMVLGKYPELHISPGRPDEEPFQIFQFDINKK
ncbi:MAG: C45 family peptidase [Candidatus Aminicenantes bacterium]|nr:C45 family peptidase [Candidatus Aminicenantes bacterium]